MKTMVTVVLQEKGNGRLGDLFQIQNFRIFFSVMFSPLHNTLSQASALLKAHILIHAIQPSLLRSSTASTPIKHTTERSQVSFVLAYQKSAIN